MLASKRTMSKRTVKRVGDSGEPASGAEAVHLGATAQLSTDVREGLGGRIHRN